MVAGPILSSPDAQRPLEDRSRAERISDNRRVELRTFPTGRDRTAGDNPLRRVAVLEVHIVEIGGERVEQQRGIGNIEPRLTAITVDRLVPCGGAGE